MVARASSSTGEAQCRPDASTPYGQIMVRMPRRGIRDAGFAACHLPCLADACVRPRISRIRAAVIVASAHVHPRLSAGAETRLAAMRFAAPAAAPEP